MITLSFVACLTAFAPQSEDTRTVARFQLGGETRPVHRAELHTELARRYRYQSLGKSALEQLIKMELIRQAAKREKIALPLKEARAMLRQVEGMLKQQKRDLDKTLAAQGMSRDDFLRFTALGLAQNKMAAKVLGKDEKAISEADRDLWAQEQRSLIPVVTNPAQLVSGVRARVGTAEITARDVGAVLYLKVPKQNFELAVNEYIFRQIIDHEARRLGVRLSQEELEAEYQRKKRAFQQSPQSKGVPYEQWLQAMGQTKEDQLRSPSMRTRLLHGKLVQKLYPAKRLEEIRAKDNVAVERKHGSRRRLSIIFWRATEKPNKLIKRSFKEAATRAQAVRKEALAQLADPRSKKLKSFAYLARVESDDPEAKLKGGDVGWHNREPHAGSHGTQLPAEVLKAAFDLEIGQISAPIRAGQGYYLVQVNGIQPPPGIGVLHQRMREEMAQIYNRKLFEAAKVEVLGR